MHGWVAIPKKYHIATSKNWTLYWHFSTINDEGAGEYGNNCFFKVFFI